MIYKTVDLYEYFGWKKKTEKGGVLTVYARERNLEICEKSRPAMLVLPGGGYTYCSPREGEAVALAFLGEGYVSAVLEYSVSTPFPTPLIEASMALVYLRENAKELFINPDCVGAIGFSAGGHLTATTATMYACEEVKTAFGARANLARPTAVVLGYPVITAGEWAHKGSLDVISGGDETLRNRLSLETQVAKDSAPAFIWGTRNDQAVPVQNALFMAQAYFAAGAPCELHLYEDGVHGLSLDNIETALGGKDDVFGKGKVRSWFRLAIDWLKTHGFEVKDVL